MKQLWNDRRCIRCAQAAPLTEEHIIPGAIGGALTCNFLCKPCNDRLGQLEAHLKTDPAIRLAIEHLKDRIPDLWQKMADGQAYVVGGGGGTVAARLMNNKIRVTPSRLADGSLIHPTEDAPRVIQTMLTREGATEPEIEQALDNFLAAPDDAPVSIADGIGVAKWTATDAQPALTGRYLDLLVTLKIAYEYLALCVEEAIFDPSLQPVRDALVPAGQVPDACSIEELHAREYRPFHGLFLEKASPYATVQIRLFGYLVYRVHFLNFLVQNCPRVAYTHHLDTGKEDSWEVELSSELQTGLLPSQPDCQG